jgi:hypothetical protein
MRCQGVAADTEVLEQNRGQVFNLDNSATMS